MAYLLTLGSVLLVIASMPLSLMFVVKVVQVRLSLNPIRSVLRYSTGSSSSDFDKMTLFIYHWEVW